MRDFDPRWFLGTVDTAGTAAGSTQSDATELTSDWVAVTTCTLGQGVKLKESPFPSPKGVSNESTTNLLVYPWSGAAFNGETANDPLTLPAGSAAIFFCFSSTKILTVFS